MVSGLMEVRVDGSAVTILDVGLLLIPVAIFFVRLA